MGCLCSKDYTAYQAHQPPTGKKVVAKKIETAAKTGVLSLQQQNLAQLPDEALQLVNLKTLDVSGNRLRTLPEEIQQLTNLKTLHAQSNMLQSLPDLSALNKLQTLTLSDNHLQHDSMGSLPASLVTLNLAWNRMTALPPCVIGLSKLQTLDLSHNQLTELDGAIGYCVGLVELILDDNSLSDLPEELARLPVLKSVSLANNRIGKRGRDGQQSIPAAIFVQTPLQKLVLTGNPISKSELFEFSGIDALLERRRQLKDRNLQGGGLVEYDVFGLD